MALMLIWSSFLALVASGLMLGFYSGSAPDWAMQIAELVTVVSVFVLICLAETSGSRPDNSNT